MLENGNIDELMAASAVIHWWLTIGRLVVENDGYVMVNFLVLMVDMVD